MMLKYPRGPDNKPLKFVLATKCVTSTGLADASPLVER